MEVTSGSHGQNFPRIEFFNKDRVKQFESQVDLEIHGGWSRAEPQKSFRIDSKSIYKGSIDYPLIPEKSNITEYNNFNLEMEDSMDGTTEFKMG